MRRAAPRPSPKKTRINLNSNGPHILLVEDDPNDILLLQRAFDKTKSLKRFHSVRNGEEAMAYLNGDRQYADRSLFPLPQLLILDLKLPRKSGCEVLQWIRQQPGLKRLPIVVLTSSKQVADVNRVYELGANSYLVKPIAFDALLELVKTVTRYWLALNEIPDVTPKKQSIQPLPVPSYERSYSHTPDR
jgi:CheY-like chemotaxis protein